MYPSISPVYRIFIGDRSVETGAEQAASKAAAMKSSKMKIYLLAVSGFLLATSKLLLRYNEDGFLVSSKPKTIISSVLCG